MTTIAAIRKLYDVASRLVDWQRDHAGDTEHRCLEAVRFCCKGAGLKLPQSYKDYSGNLAITCGKALAKNPAKWGWKLLGTDADAVPTNRPTLVFFKDCGLLTKGPNAGKQAGHVAIFKPSTAHIVANTTYSWSKTWAQKVAYVVEPVS
jgi:hypothetical protein